MLKMEMKDARIEILAKITWVKLNTQWMYFSISFIERIYPCRPLYGQTKIGLWKNPSKKVVPRSERVTVLCLLTLLCKTNGGSVIDFNMQGTAAIFGV